MTTMRASFRNTPEFKEFKKALAKLSYPSKNAKIQLRNKIKKLYKLNSDLMSCDVQNIINTSEDVQQCISKAKALQLKTTGICKLYQYTKQYNTIRDEYYQMRDEFITQYKQSVIKLKSKRSSKITRAKAYMILCKLYQLLNLSVPSCFLEVFMDTHAQ